MDQLREYLNSLAPIRQREFAKKCGTTIGYLRKAISTSQLLHPATCVQIEQLSEGKVSRTSLRPKDWRCIWPELYK